MLSSHPMAKFPKPCLSTPSILLANRQIYREAKAILNKKLFVIDLTHLQRLDVDPVPDIMEFIGIITLQKLQHTRLELTFEGTAYGWLKDVDALIDVWSQECSLQTLEVTILDEDQDLRDGWYPASVISELQRMSQRVRLSVFGSMLVLSVGVALMLYDSCAIWALGFRLPFRVFTRPIKG